MILVFYVSLLSKFETIHSRSLSFWNHSPNKVGFIGLHRPKSIENRRIHQQNHVSISHAKFSLLCAGSTCSLVTLDLPTISLISPRHAFSIQFGDIVKFPKFTTHNGARLVQFDIDVGLSKSPGLRAGRADCKAVTAFC